MKIKYLIILIFYFNISYSKSPNIITNPNIFSTQKNNDHFFQWGIYMDFSALNSNLKNINNTLPQSSNKLKTINNAIGIGTSFTSNYFSFITEVQFGFKQRIFINDYEQFTYHRGRWGNLFGLTITNKKRNLFILPQVGFSLDWQEIHYANDSFGKASSVSWLDINNRDPNLTNNFYLTNPSFSLISGLRITKVFGERYGISGFVTYQRDVSNGKWRFQEDFVRRNSPDTYTTGLTYGFSIGLYFKGEDFD